MANSDNPPNHDQKEDLKICGVVLTGGNSIRFGKDKSNARFEGRSFLEHSIEKLRPLCNEVYISVGTMVVENEMELPYVKIMDTEGFEGPLAGILASFQGLKADYLYVLAVDLPIISASSLFNLKAVVSDNLTKSPPVLVLASQESSGRVQPLAGLWHHSLAESLVKYLASGKRSVMGFIDAYSPILFAVPDRELSNINFPEDLSDISG